MITDYSGFSPRAEFVNVAFDRRTTWNAKYAGCALSHLGVPRPSEGEIVLGRWVAREARLRCDDPANAATLRAEGSFAVLVTDRSIRMSVLDGACEELGCRLWSGVNAPRNSKIQTLITVWPFDVVDEVGVGVLGGMKTAHIHLGGGMFDTKDAVEAKDDMFVTKGLGLRNLSLDMGAQIGQAYRRFHGAEVDAFENKDGRRDTEMGFRRRTT